MARMPPHEWPSRQKFVSSSLAPFEEPPRQIGEFRGFGDYDARQFDAPRFERDAMILLVVGEKRSRTEGPLSGAPPFYFRLSGGLSMTISLAPRAK